ncbi:putative RNA triphosphatase [Trypanosoma grayi]|uniref:putative RNA triphosphatase n=1 Tax=Trypanosoma grayi TaxID=71804 RepID=UPI0004F42448|nr:putative RNA triphosphatase [Trypanosoma grayi]KEG13253.1 putative RNA triphosphatase [Trypanosoma grayi]
MEGTRSAELRALARILFDRLQPHRSNPSLEVEVRLCRFEKKRDSHVNSSSSSTAQGGLRFVEAKVTPGVSAEDYERIRAHWASNETGRAVSHSTTRDVVKNGWRYTYTTDEPTHCIACVQKKRLFVSDILVPPGAYNLRFSASIETCGPLPAAGDPPKVGFTRVKERHGVTDGLFRYDMTNVTTNGTVVHEVEIEGVFTECEVQLTEAWLEELLSRAVAVATLPKKSESRSSGYGRGIRKRCRESETMMSN